MLGDRQELDVGEAHRRHVVGELVGELAIAEEAVALFGHAPPRAQVHLVDRHRRRCAARCAAALGHPVRVAATRSRRGRTTADGGARRRRARRRRRTGPPSAPAARPIAADDLVLVARARRPRPGTKSSQMPLPGMQAHGMTPPVPAVPVADHADAPRVGRPHREAARRPRRRRRAGWAPSLS